MTPEQERRNRLLFPYAFEKIDLAKSNNTRFVHYTSAETAFSIISKKSIWMRNSVTMNDYSEIHHGTECLLSAYRGEPGAQFRSAIDAIRPGLAQRIHDIFFGEWLNTFRTNTYLTSFSEHDGKEEDERGRLSMWRAYGGDSGVALVVHNTPFFSEKDALGAYSSPVAYWDKDDFAREMLRVADGIARNVDAFQYLPDNELLDSFFTMLMFAVLCTKHPGFAEEREWRSIYTPTLRRSPVLEAERDVQCVRGVPQIIYKIPLRDIPEHDLTGLAVRDVIERVIIGPTLYPYPSYLALAALLEEAGLPDAGERVHASNIPLRR
jgi:hypothetical protein